MKKITYSRRHWLTGRWSWPETIVLPDEGARRFCRDARRSKSHRIWRVRRCA